jgi:hypothetical protein
MQQDHSTTLIEFLQATGARVSIYDMGRRTVRIPGNQFLKFEKTLLPYPQPLQNHACFGLSMLDRSVSDEPVIWFLRLPLDEQGKLVQSSRDYFIQRLLEVAVEKQAGRHSSTDAFKDNPYIFKPKEDRMAVFHARLAHDLGHAPSRYYAHSLDYFSGNPGWDQWSFVGYQGIADMAARVHETAISDLLVQAIPMLPQSPVIALCHCLENESLALPLSQGIMNRLEAELATSEPDLSIITALVRGLSLSVAATIKEQMFELVMNSPYATHIELLAALSGRVWELLKQPEHASCYLEALAHSPAGQSAFNHCLTDLLAIPGLRTPLLQAVRNPDRSDELASAFGAMMQQCT